MSVSNSVVCEEIFDDSSHPSNDEVRDYATKIGIDPDSEPQLLPLAAEGLMRALPPGWKPCLDEKSRSYYYYNNLTGKTQWEHPLDDVYRGLVRKKRTESQSLSLGEPNEDATYTRDDLPSLEEPPLLAKQFENLSLGARKKEPKIYGRARILEDFGVPKLIRQKSEERPIACYVNKKVGLSLSSSFDGKSLVDSPKKEFKVLGGGQMFLKKKKGEGDEEKNEDASKKKGAGKEEVVEVLKEKRIEGEEVKDKSEEEQVFKKIEVGQAIKKFGVEDGQVSMKMFEGDEALKKKLGFEEGQALKKMFEGDEALKKKFGFEEEQALKKRVEEDAKTEAPRGILRERSFVESLKLEEDEKTKNVRFKLEESPELQFEFSEKNFGEQDQKSLKLIRPNPKDFVKKEHVVSDSEDDSILKSIEKKKDNLEILEKLKETADKELENMKKIIWDEKNFEITKYKEKLQESQQGELERILLDEKEKYEENIKNELENLRLEMESRNLGALEQERRKLEEDLDQKTELLQNEFSQKKTQLEAQFSLEEIFREFRGKEEEARKKFAEKLEELEKDLGRDLEKHKDELIVSHNAILDQLRRNHQAILDELKQDFKSEEKIIRREHESQIAELKKKVNGSFLDFEANHKDQTEERLYEKVRCEKRLLEDKYRCLKEKYLRLKTDVKLSIEKRNRKREQSATTTTGSETERSNSINKEKSPNRLLPPFQKDPNRNNKPEHKTTRTIIIQDLDTSTSDRSCKLDPKNEDSSEENANAGGRSRKRLFSRVKTPVNVRAGNKKRSQRSCSPVENLRRQLQKLEDLEDQFPQNAQGDTYHLRYPFSDGQKFEGSSELEFFRHRIHLERDSIKRAKESLRTQKCLFQQRQNDLKLKHGSMARHTLHQLCQEEKDLTDMEVSLHRTRSLLGEKVIRLRHLEQSLQRATAASNEQAKNEETTLSDLSSHSASSGISSTEFATAGDGAVKTILRGEHLQESSEIIQSLENLNSEIREIWEVLNQHQAGNMASVYPDLGWPVLGGAATLPAPPSIPTLADRLHNYRQHVALANAQSTVVTHAANQGATTTLVERTRNLRHWLRQAGIDPGSDGAVATQATL